MGHQVTVASAQLAQMALDFEGNTNRIIESCRLAKEAGAKLRVGPELEISGYGVQDSFLEADTYFHSWECVEKILQHPHCQDILLDIGLPVMHRNVRYNCRLLILNGDILLIRPKIWLANDGNYREMRWFTPWSRPRHVEEYYLPRKIRNITGKTTVPIGDAVISAPDTCIGAETCEELFTVKAPHIDMGLNGVEIITNSSGSHWEIAKLETRISLIMEATRKNGGIYLYSNLIGCDGERVLYDGCSMIICNGNIVAQASQFSLKEVEVITATVDLEEVRSYRSSVSRALQAVLQTDSYQRIQTKFALSLDVTEIDPHASLSKPIEPRLYTLPEEIELGPPCYLWRYLCRTGAAGYMLALSGGVDSCATATIVYSMCRIVVKEIKEGNEQVIADCRRICAEPDPEWLPASAEELCGKIFAAAYMGSKKMSSADTRRRARQLCERINGYFINLDIDTVIEAIMAIFEFATKFTPRFKAHGGTAWENLALQNVQARVRMVIIYLFAQLLPTVRRRPNGGGLLVLGSANVDESLYGYLTKYDCSSADFNPIGGLSKTDLKSFIAFARGKFDMPILEEFLNATPTAELEPLSDTYVQSDEADMGLTYAELSVLGHLRKVEKLGPCGMFIKLVSIWKHVYPREVYEKVKRFHTAFNRSRHKMTVITPSLHSCPYSPDDNRFDQRPFLFPSFDYIWKKIEGLLGKYEEKDKMQ